MNLQLSLKKKWFDLTKSKVKTEDYRELNYYWFSRLVFDSQKACEFYNIKTDQGVINLFSNPLLCSSIAFKPFTTTTVTSGYPRESDSDRILKLAHKGIEVRTGNPEWGAVPGQLYFVIKHGDVLDKKQKISSLLYKPEDEQTIEASIVIGDEKISIEFSSDCGKFGMHEMLAGFILTPKRLLQILSEREDITDEEL
jgi:hypothetical protein